MRETRKDTRTRPTADSKYVVITYSRSYYFDALEEAIKFARKKQQQNSCTQVNLYEVKRNGKFVNSGTKIEF